MIELSEYWVWDSWYAWHEGTLHAYYLKAPKSLGDPDRRHHHARVGHSTSTDGVTWSHHQDALNPSDAIAFDDQAIWTGSVLRHEGLWHMFYTGIDRRSMGKIQRIGHATSSDLFTWTRVGTEPILTARFPEHATAQTDPRQEEPFRDPWVFWFEGSWHMLATARSSASDTKGAGNMAHAISSDLYHWQLADSMLNDSGFDQLEVFQMVEVSGRWFLIFCTQPADIHRPGIPRQFTTYAAPATGPLGPYQIDEARPITGEAGGIYAGRVVQMPNGSAALFGFVESGLPGGFGGVISDPLPLTISAEGSLVLDVEQAGAGRYGDARLNADVAYRS